MIENVTNSKRQWLVEGWDRRWLKFKKSRKREAREIDFSLCVLKSHDDRHNEGEEHIESVEC